MPLKQIILWMIPLVFLVAGTVFYFLVSGCSFLGIVFWVVAVIFVIYKLLTLWKTQWRQGQFASR